MKTLKIKYFDSNMPRLEHIGGNEVSNWIDVRAVKIEGHEWISKEKFRAIYHSKGDFLLIKLGFALELPKGYEAHVIPRSSLFKKHGLILVNSFGLIDEKYCGDNDEWLFGAYAIRDGYIEQYERIGQFRIMKKMEPVEFLEVRILGNKDRGGNGSTGSK